VCLIAAYALGSIRDAELSQERQAGMPAEVYIRTDSRSAFDYMFAPVTAYLRGGTGEPL